MTSRHSDSQTSSRKHRRFSKNSSLGSDTYPIHRETQKPSRSIEASDSRSQFVHTLEQSHPNSRPTVRTSELPSSRNSTQPNSAVSTSSDKQVTESPYKRSYHHPASTMDMFQFHAICTSGWLSLHGITLMLIPGTICSSLIQETRPLSDLEAYLARTGALAELTLALLLLTLSGALTTFLTSSSDPSTASSSTNDPSTRNPKTPLLVCTTFLTTTRAVLYYLNTNSAAFNSAPFFVEMCISGALAGVGGGMVLFGSGAGSDVKGRSHLMFESPEHKREVKERHAAKKGL